MAKRKLEQRTKRKLLVVVRHGEYYLSDGRLSELGRQQMADLAAKLKPLIADGAVCMLVSTEPRAQDSADVLARELGGVQARASHQVLCSWGGYIPDDDVAVTLELVRKKFDVEALILVTHFEYVRDFPTVYGKAELGAVIEPRELHKGRCRVVFCDEKRAEVL